MQATELSTKFQAVMDKFKQLRDKYETLQLENMQLQEQVEGEKSNKEEVEKLHARILELEAANNNLQENINQFESRDGNIHNMLDEVLLIIEEL